MNPVVVFLLALPLAALAVLFAWIDESNRQKVLRRNDRALGRQVPARCPVPGRRTCIRSGCLHWSDTTGCRHPPPPTLDR